MLGEITREIQELCVWLRAGKHENYEKAFAVHAVIVDLLGAKLKAEFWQEHDESVIYFEYPPNGLYCCECGSKELDPRHNYDDRAWWDAAGRVLSKGESGNDRDGRVD